MWNKTEVVVNGIDLPLNFNSPYRQNVMNVSASHVNSGALFIHALVIQQGDVVKTYFCVLADFTAASALCLCSRISIHELVNF